MAAELSPVERRVRLLFIGGLVVVFVLLASLVTLLSFLSIDAYHAAEAGASPSPGEVVVGLVRDAAIILVAFETSLVGILLMILMLQMRSLIILLRDEIKPMLEAVNETLATVRGTTQFVSHNVVSPMMKWSGYLAGVRRIWQSVSGLLGTEQEDDQNL